MTETQLRRQMVRVGRSLFARGYSFGTSGNLSARGDGFILVTPTGCSLESLEAGGIAKVGLDGAAAGGPQPSKEAHVHLAIYRARPDAGAVVHLHSTYAVAVSCLKTLNVEDAMPVLTPYYAMRAGRLPVAPYLPPGDPRLASEVEKRAGAARAVLLRNHGPVVWGKDLPAAAALAEELEEQARLFLLLGDRGRRLTRREIAELRSRFG
jgi:ribulose-5-phosphate 4-epimerase/fuculose-1-phosphate aldolase